MANYCWSKITAAATDSEWKEISTAFNNDQIDWSDSTDGPDCDDLNKEISCEDKWGPVPWKDGKMAALSRSYPSVQFYYHATYEGGEQPDSAWFCNGEETNKSGASNSKKQAYQDEVHRFASATPNAAEGITHRVEVMPDGRVAADGENRFGECNIFSWAKIKAISCGNWHTVGLKRDGTLVACGSNANGQCNIDDVLGKVIAISCGRYHTAILFDSGRVEIRGTLQQEAQATNIPAEREFTPTDFPLICDLQLNKYIKGWEKMNDRIENLVPGDELTLKKISKDGEIRFEVLIAHDEKIGEISTEGNESLSKMLTFLKITANTVTPLSTRRKGSKYAAMTIRVDYIQDTENQVDQKTLTSIENYTQTRVTSWPPVVKIKSVFDAVIGLTADNKILIDGFCPCSENDIRKYIGFE